MLLRVCHNEACVSLCNLTLCLMIVKVKSISSESCFCSVVKLVCHKALVCVWVRVCMHVCVCVSMIWMQLSVFVCAWDVAVGEGLSNVKMHCDREREPQASENWCSFHRFVFHLFSPPPPPPPHGSLLFNLVLSRQFILSPQLIDLLYPILPYFICSRLSLQFIPKPPQICPSPSFFNKSFFLSFFSKYLLTSTGCS